MSLVTEFAQRLPGICAMARLYRYLAKGSIDLKGSTLEPRQAFPRRLLGLDQSIVVLDIGNYMMPMEQAGFDVYGLEPSQTLSATGYRAYRNRRLGT